MADSTFETIVANRVIAESVATSPYFTGLHNLIINCEVTTKNGIKISLDQGMQKVLDMVYVAQKADRKVMLIGNGGSAAIASHEALDFWKNGGVRATSFNDPMQLTCLGNDCGYENIFSKAIEMFAQPGDVLLAISSSGKSASILNGVAAARDKQCDVVTYAGFAVDTPLRSLGDINFYVGSSSYGHVEVAHLALIHYLTDIIGMQRRGADR